MRLPVPTSLAGRIAAAVLAALILLLLLAQLFLPRLGESAIEKRLTENGGVAEVSLSATPALRLLWGQGDALSISGAGLDLEMVDEPAVFDDLDRFDEVEVAISDSDAGPFDLESFVLRRAGDEAYTLESRASTSIADLARFGVANAQLPGSGIVGGILELTGVAGRELPIDLDMRLESDDGRIRVVAGGGEVAGIPTGPLAELITSAIVVRL